MAEKLLSSLTAARFEHYSPAGMSAYIPSRRQFLRTSIAASCFPALARLGWSSGIAYDRTSWYCKAKFGMFIHWGAYSQASVEASWPIMVPKPGGITEAAYRALPQTFNPVKFDPNAFVELARLAGQEYMGMPLGFYYSPPDMHHPGFRDTTKLAKENWHGEPQRPEWSSYLDYMQLQLAELLTRYGPVAIVWFDGLNDQRKYNGARVIEMIRELQSDTLVNDRLGVDGDYETPEQFIPTAIPTKGIVLTGIDPQVSKQLKNSLPRREDFRLWETCMTINNTWAYNKNDRDFKSEQTLIRALVEVASRGGNFLLNVGPEPAGQIQAEVQQRLRAIGDWLTLNGDSIYGTTYGPVQGVASLRTTANDKSIFVHIFDWPATAACEITGIEAKVMSARLLASGKPLIFHQSEGKLHIDVPQQAPDPNVSVIALKTY